MEQASFESLRINAGIGGQGFCDVPRRSCQLRLFKSSSYAFIQAYFKEGSDVCLQTFHLGLVRLLSLNFSLLLNDWLNFFFFFKWGWEEGGSIALWFLTNLKSCNWFTVAWGPSGYFSKN